MILIGFRLFPIQLDRSVPAVFLLKVSERGETIRAYVYVAGVRSRGGGFGREGVF